MMNTGMLWFDNNPKTDLTTKIHKAADYYQKKYGIKPDLCFLNPITLKDKAINAKEIQVEPSKQILPNHIWIGIRESIESISAQLMI